MSKKPDPKKSVGNTKPPPAPAKKGPATGAQLKKGNSLKSDSGSKIIVKKTEEAKKTEVEPPSKPVVSEEEIKVPTFFLSQIILSVQLTSK